MKLRALYPFVDRESKFSLVVRRVKCLETTAWSIQTTGRIVVAHAANW